MVFVLNRYFAAMGRAVEAAGGRVDKFIGDGVMALFGIERGAQAGCREALTAARLMSERLPELNASLRAELDRPLRIGIGGRLSSERWATATLPRLPRSATPLIQRAGSKA